MMNSDPDMPTTERGVGVAKVRFNHERPKIAIFQRLTVMFGGECNFQRHTRELDSKHGFMWHA